MGANDADVSERDPKRAGNPGLADDAQQFRETGLEFKSHRYRAYDESPRHLVGAFVIVRGAGAQTTRRRLPSTMRPAANRARDAASGHADSTPVAASAAGAAGCTSTAPMSMRPAEIRVSPR
jgi:hypothetical protein